MEIFAKYVTKCNQKKLIWLRPKSLSLSNVTNVTNITNNLYT